MTSTIKRVGNLPVRYDFGVALRLLGYDPEEAARKTPGALTLPAIAEQLNTATRTVHRWTVEGIPDHQADRVAIELLGLPAMLVWPEWSDWSEGRDEFGRRSR